MTNCKTCTHQEVCKKAIKDWHTYRVCDDYQGTCENCEHRRNLWIMELCGETGWKCEEMGSCGLWEERSVLNGR